MSKACKQCDPVSNEERPFEPPVMPFRSGLAAGRICPRCILYDIRAIRKYDPACRSIWEVIFCYPGFHAVCAHRVIHKFYNMRLFLIARLLSQIVRFLTGVEIHPGATLGNGVFIDHAHGVVIGETAIIGDHCIIYQGVTLGGTGKAAGKRHPTLEPHVTIGAGAKILGNITIGSYSRVGAGSVVVHDVPEHATVVGIPGKVVRLRKVPSAQCLDHGDLEPETVPDRVARLDELDDEALAQYMPALRNRLHRNMAEGFPLSD
ncbi:Serine O-acetyltransferase [Carpediemonas membranifera]|uniref:Serine acetyltransferase n=1 Tax=Carpediemonas membranifera TaxID=201153 RepID=A0A8J6BCK9_9EUKA|nr:Serine O-acetyltransferase [Carpediemonas membranifera]|eukprot:KAG9397397.1 Serine O-acetyltransferase [Carpediemonas membranifera]